MPNDEWAMLGRCHNCGNMGRMGDIHVHYGDECHIYACIDDENDLNFSSSHLDHAIHAGQRMHIHTTQDKNNTRGTHNDAPPNQGTTYMQPTADVSTNLTGGVEVDPAYVSPGRAEVGPDWEPHTSLPILCPHI